MPGCVGWLHAGGARECRGFTDMMGFVGVLANLNTSRNKTPNKHSTHCATEACFGVPLNGITDRFANSIEACLGFLPSQIKSPIASIARLLTL
jgi:hypothetical protein